MKIRTPFGFVNGLGTLIIALLTSNIGYAIHKSVGWAIADFFFFPLAWLKWIILREVNLTIIKSAFDWFMK